MILHEARGGDVGGQQALLDQLVRIVTLGWADLVDLAIGAEDDTGFLRLEVDGAALVTSGHQHLVQRIELIEVRQDFLVLAAQGLALAALGVLQHQADLVVGQARVGVDHRLVELVVDHLAALGPVSSPHLAEARAAQLAELEVTITATAGDEGKLFGSIGTHDIADALTASGVEVAKAEVRLPNGTIRQVGEYDVALHLHTDVEATVKVIVVAA